MLYIQVKAKECEVAKANGGTGSRDGVATKRRTELMADGSRSRVDPIVEKTAWVERRQLRLLILGLPAFLFSLPLALSLPSAFLFLRLRLSCSSHPSRSCSVGAYQLATKWPFFQDQAYTMVE